MSESGSVNLETLQQLDRLISASRPSDALESIETLTLSIQNIYKSDLEDKRVQIVSIVRTCYENVEFMTCICSLLSDGAIKSGTKSMTVEDGDSTVCSFLSTLIESLDLKPKDRTKTGNPTIKTFNQERKNHLKKFLSSPNDGAVIHALVDLLSPGHPSDPRSAFSTALRNNLYAQTQALRIISTLAVIMPAVIHSHILSAPDGLNRIVDLLHNSSVEESIRNESILLCTTMAKTNAGCARLMIFGETYEKVLQIAENEVSQDIGSSGISSASAQVIVDCFNLAIELTKQDDMGSEVFLGSKGLVQILMKFLDLRTGQRFVHPEVNSFQEDELDDLDAILNTKSNSRNKIDSSIMPGKIPYLTEFESTVVLSALELVRVLIVGADTFVQGESVSDEMTNLKRKKQGRQASILSHDLLSRLLIDMALYTLPPSDSPVSAYVSAVPTHLVQLTALDIFSALSLDSGEKLQQAIMDKPGIYLHAGVLDRLMYLVCTGDGVNRLGREADEISMHSLGVLRCLLSAKDASKMLLHTLAPPPPVDDQGEDSPSICQKIVNTLVENLYHLMDQNVSKTFDESDIHRSNRMIIGASGALGIFLTNGAGETTRTMLLRVPVPPPPKLEPPLVLAPMNNHHSSIADCLLMYLERYTNKSFDMPRSSDVLAAILRLFVEWIPSSPEVISAVLSDPNSIIFSVLLKEKIDAKKPPTTQAFSGLFLGICMANLGPEDEIGGWTRANIVNLITNGMGISKFTQLLERLRRILVSQDGSIVVPWSACPTERKYLIEWYTENVSIVRKKAIEELASTGQCRDSDEEEENAERSSNITSTRKDHKNVNTLISDQIMEIESLKAELSHAEENLAAKSSQIIFLMKRLDANPSQMDDVMNEMLEKISDLEKQNASLNSELMISKVNGDNALNAKMEENELLKASVNQIEAAFTESEKQKSVFQEELQGLSSSYTLLESEYNKLLRVDEKKEEVVPLSSLRLLEQENLKIKNDMKAANDWMQKAVHRIDDLTKRNNALNSEVSESKSSYRLQIQSMQFDFSSKLNQSDLTIETLKKQISDLESKISVQYESSNQNMTNEAELNIRIAFLENELKREKVHAETSLLEVRNMLISKDNRLVELESKLQELESLSNLSEIEKLKKANEAAQEWMANAVKHHSALKKQLEEANRRVEFISSSKNETIDSSNILSTEFHEQIKLLETERDDAIGRIQEMKRTVDELQVLLAIKDSELSLRESEKKALENSVSTLNIRLNDLEKKLSENEIQLSQYQSKVLESNTLVLSMEESINFLTNERSEHLLAIENMKTSLAEFQSWTETAQHRINELEKEKEDIEKRLRYSDGNIPNSIAEKPSSEEHLNEEDNTDPNQNQKITEEVTDINLRLEELARNKIDLEFIVQSLKDRNTSLEAELKIETKRFNDLLEECNKVQAEVFDLKSESESLRSRISSLMDELSTLDEKNQVLESLNAELQLRCNDLEECKKSLHEKGKEFSVVEQALKDKEAELFQLETESSAEIRQRIDQIQNLESENQDLRTLIQNQEKSTIDAISQWEARCSELEDDIERLKIENETGMNALESIKLWEIRYSELETQLKSIPISFREAELEDETKQLKEEINQVKGNADLAISQWEERTHLLEVELKRLLSESSDMINLHEQILVLEKELLSKDVQLKDAVSSADTHREKFTSLEMHLNSVEHLYANHVKELESAIVSHEEENTYLQSQLDQRDDLIENLNQQISILTKDVDETRVKSEEVVKEWQENSNHQEKTISNLEHTIALQKEEAILVIQQWESRCNKLSERIEELTTEVEEIRESQNTSSIQVELEMRTDELCKLKLAYDALATRENTLEKSLNELKQSYSIYDQVQNERDNLLDLKCSLENEIQRLNVKLHETESSQKLHIDEVNNLREIQQQNIQTILDFKKDRKLLEDELKNLKSDVMLLVSMYGHDQSELALQKLSSKAAVDVLEKDHEEIVGLRKVLDEALYKLANYQGKERNVESRLAEAHFKLSVCENELLATKAEAEMVQNTLRSSILDASKQRLELEERIALLEQERNKLNARNVRKMDALKEENLSLKIERDTLMHTLEESENANAALVQCTVMDQTESTNSSVEISRLRLENANLLMTISKMSSSMEKRVRSALNTDLTDTTSASEYNSLRENFNTVCLELDQLKIQNEELLEKVKNHTEHLNTTIAQLEKDKTDLESKFKLQLIQREDDFKNLQESYDEAKERLKRFESSVKETSIFSKKSSDGHIEGVMDELSRTKSMYKDLWSEHEDLLALLAQQDCEKRCLEEELLNSVGQDAIDRAMQSVHSKLNDELGMS